MQLSDSELNRIADYIVASAMTCRIHTADPGTSGTTARIGSLSQNLAAANWSNGSGGDVQYNADVSFGVVDAAAAKAVTHYSLWRGNDFVGRGGFVGYCKCDCWRNLQNKYWHHRHKRLDLICN